MRRTLIYCAAAILPASAQAATFTFRDFKIPGATSVAIAAINDFGVATGTYGSTTRPNSAGFAGRRGQITVIANFAVGGPNPAVPSPAGITNDGTVIGTVYTGLTSVFTWKAGAYTNTLGGGTYYTGPNYVPPTLTIGNHVSYNVYDGDGLYSAYAGVVGSEQHIDFGGFTSVTSTNRRGEIAGQYQTFVGTHLTGAVFFGGPKHVKSLLPPGAASSACGWLNDVAQVAGTYQDKTGALHSFVFDKGNYTTFDMPRPPTTLTVQGIDLSGRVVGAYQAGQVQHGYIYSHGTVTPVGNAAPTDKLHVSISHFGRAIALSITKTDGTSKSYTVRCDAGPGNC